MSQLARSLVRPGFEFFTKQRRIFPTLEFYNFIKRLIDISVSLPLIILGVPFLPIAWLMVTYQSPGSLFYTQQRGGANGSSFKIFKLRTMHSHLCDDGAQQAVHKDTRVSKWGKVFRHFSIDELPQLYNVLIGDMSLIGPRPHSVPMDIYYQQYIPHYNDRYKVKPGVTGMAQVYGHRGETKIIQDMEERIALDVEYIHKKSLWLDIIILLKTCHIVFNI